MAKSDTSILERIAIICKSLVSGPEIYNGFHYRSRRVTPAYHNTLGENIRFDNPHHVTYYSLLWKVLVTGANAHVTVRGSDVIIKGAREDVIGEALTIREETGDFLHT